MSVAHLYCCISCHVSRNLFLIDCTVGILCVICLCDIIYTGRTCQITFRHIQCYEFHIRIYRRFFYNRCCKQISRKYQNIVSVCNRLVTACDTCFVRVSVWFVVVEVKTIFLTECLACFISGLIKRLVCDIT